MSLRSLLTQRCTIARATPTNTDGIVSNAYAAVATDVRCLVQEKAGRIRATPAGQLIEFSAMAFFETGANVRPGSAEADSPDRITLTTPANGKVYFVQYVGDEAGKAGLLTAYLKAQ